MWRAVVSSYVIYTNCKCTYLASCEDSNLERERERENEKRAWKSVWHTERTVCILAILLLVRIETC